MAPAPHTVLIFHGYLLSRTGSNVYNANLARALVRLGHDVHLLAQERRPQELDFVDAVGDWDGGALAVRSLREPPGPGRCTVYRPDIGGVLPVFVYDRYEGVEAKEYAALTEPELEQYLAANVEAVAEVAALAGPDAALANHLVMGPCVLARGLPPSVPYAVKVHGSALEYTVKPQPQRFLPYAREGLERAAAVLVGSRHTAESLWATLGDPALPSRTRLGPPGVDVREFAPRSPAAARAGLAALAGRLAAMPRDGFGPAQAAALDELAGGRPGDEALAAVRATHDPAGVDPGAPAAVASLEPDHQRVVAYVGKLIVSKGVDLLLCAWPLVLAREPRARLAVVGFGTGREGLELLLRALERGDRGLLDHVIASGRELEGGPAGPLAHLRSFFDGLSGGAAEGYFAAARGLRASLAFTGRLEHAELADLLPACEAQVVPSTFPEAFGMVAAEGAACGAWPVVARHSGLEEVVAELAPVLAPARRGLLTFDLGPRAVHDLADRLVAWLGLPAAERRELSARVRAVAADSWSWEGVARRVLLAAAGRLDELPEP